MGCHPVHFRDMQFDILTLFPDMFTGPLTESIIKRAVQAGTIGIGVHDIRTYATDRHHTADDAPYGGGAGMVMKAEPLAAAIRAVIGDTETRRHGDNEIADATCSLSLSPALPASPARQKL